MKIGIAQIACTLGDVQSNCSKITGFAQKAGDNGCDVIVFPEMVDTGYEMNTIHKTASAWPGMPFEIAQQAALDNSLYLFCGLSEKEKGNIYNTMAVFNPAGKLIGKYRKAHLASYPPLNEDSCITPGDSRQIITIGDMKWGLMICYDLRFLEFSRSLTLDGAEILVLCSAWPFPRLIHWKTLTCARAIENQTYFIAANRVGIDNGVTFCGASQIVDPYGIIVTSAAENREELIIGEIDKDIVSSVRSNIPIFQHRRNELYRL